MFQVIDLLRTKLMHAGNRPEYVLTLGKLRVLGSLFASEDHPLMIKDIATKFNITPGAVSKTVDQLVREGIVQRTMSTKDHRAVSITLTEEGQKKREFNDAIIDEIMSDLIERVPEEKQEVFLEVLHIFADAMEELDVSAIREKFMEKMIESNDSPIRLPVCEK